MSRLSSLFRLLPALLASVLAAPLALSGQESPDGFATRVPLELSGEGPWYRLELPLALHLTARHADLRDLRVFNGEGEPLAYALTLGSTQPSETHTETPVKWFPLYSPASAPDSPHIRVQRGTGGTLVEVTEGQAADAGEVLRGWVLDASALKQPLQKLILDWSADREGFQRFTIEASDDLQQWRSWGDGQIARLSFADERIDQREVALPGLRARYLRLLWESPQQAPALTQALVVSSTRVPAPIAWSGDLPPRRAGNGEFYWELPLALPLERLHIELPQANTLAPVTVQGRRDDRQQWFWLARGLLYRLPENGSEVRQETLELPGTPVHQLKLQVDERGGGLGSATPRLQVGVRTTQVVFLVRGTPPYTLALGNATAKAANLPLATLIPGYDDERLARLGVATPTGEAVTATVKQDQPEAGTDWKRIGLWAVLVAGVGLLVLMALSVLRSPATPRQE